MNEMHVHGNRKKKHEATKKIMWYYVAQKRNMKNHNYFIYILGYNTSACNQQEWNDQAKILMFVFLLVAIRKNNDGQYTFHT